MENKVIKLTCRKSGKMYAEDFKLVKNKTYLAFESEPFAPYTVVFDKNNNKICFFRPDQIEYYFFSVKEIRQRKLKKLNKC